MPAHLRDLTAQETWGKSSERTLPSVVTDGAAYVPAPERMDWHPVYLFVRYFETLRVHLFAWGARTGVEGWLPIASLMNSKVLLLTGRHPRIHPAGTLLLIVFLAMSLIFRKSFCWLALPDRNRFEISGTRGAQALQTQLPVASLARYSTARHQVHRGGLIRLRGCIDVVAAVRQFLESSYGIVDDVKMRNLSARSA